MKIAMNFSAYFFHSKTWTVNNWMIARIERKRIHECHDNNKMKLFSIKRTFDSCYYKQCMDVNAHL